MKMLIWSPDKAYLGLFNNYLYASNGKWAAKLPAEQCILDHENVPDGVYSLNMQGTSSKVFFPHEDEEEDCQIFVDLKLFEPEPSFESSRILTVFTETIVEYFALERKDYMDLRQVASKGIYLSCLLKNKCVKVLL